MAEKRMNKERNPTPAFGDASKHHQIPPKPIMPRLSVPMLFSSHLFVMVMAAQRAQGPAVSAQCDAVLLRLPALHNPPLVPYMQQKEERRGDSTCPSCPIVSNRRFVSGNPAWSLWQIPRPAQVPGSTPSLAELLHDNGSFIHTTGTEEQPSPFQKVRPIAFRRWGGIPGRGGHVQTTCGLGPRGVAKLYPVCSLLVRLDPSSRGPFSTTRTTSEKHIVFAFVGGEAQANKTHLHSDKESEFSSAISGLGGMNDETMFSF
mmetsp:Transcript_26423/g.61483  ORF Transcript_26423/g.61483 Transcript_26423/m.61483 type:complete len:260 (-) Transcript_26423:763-1542(-)